MTPPRPRVQPVPARRPVSPRARPRPDPAAPALLFGRRSL